MPIETHSFIWKSTELKAAEWAYAKDTLAPNGQMMPDGTKLRRKEGYSTHSFIVLNQKIFAMAPKGEYLGVGSFGHAKLAEDERGALWALKIVTKVNKSESRTAQDLYQALQSSHRGKKQYIPYKYLGLSLGDYLADDTWRAYLHKMFKKTRKVL